MYGPRMPFGKHQGEYLCDIPTSYLRWVLRECRNADYWLRRQVQAEVDRRDAEEAAHQQGYRQDYRQKQGSGQPPPRSGLPAQWSEVISKWYRTMAMRFHPDRGGTHEQMLVIQAAKEELEKLAGVA